MRKGFAFPKASALTTSRLGWKAEPSSRAGVQKGGCLGRKARGFPHGRRQSRFFRGIDATLAFLPILLDGNGRAAVKWLGSPFNEIG